MYCHAAYTIIIAMTQSIIWQYIYSFTIKDKHNKSKTIKSYTQQIRRKLNVTQQILAHINKSYEITYF